MASNGTVRTVAVRESDMQTLAYGVWEALHALDLLCQRKAKVPDEVYQARESLKALRELLAEPAYQVA